MSGLMLFTCSHLTVLAVAGKRHMCRVALLSEGPAAHLQQVLGEPGMGTTLPLQPLVLQQAVGW